MTSVWQPIQDSNAGYMYSLSDSVRIYEANNPDLLYPITGNKMIIASDYSGQHKEATHESYSFLITSDINLMEWLPRLKVFRNKWLPDGRRLSFKKLNEPVRWRALPAYLETLGQLKGNLITVMVDRQVDSFISGGPASAIEVFPDCFPLDAKHGTVEKMLRLASFVALILSGLRRENQKSIWISDHDEALDSHDKREQFARLATYLTFGLTGWRRPADHHFSTTELPASPYWAEDIASIADLAAGAYCNMSSHLPAYLGKETWKIRVAPGSVKDKRARAIGNWLASDKKTLKHVLLRLEQDTQGGIRSSAQSFS